MWLSKKKLSDLLAHATGQGYKVGYQAGQIEMINRLWRHIPNIEAVRDELQRMRQHQTLVEKEIEDILDKAEGEGML